MSDQVSYSKGERVPRSGYGHSPGLPRFAATLGTELRNDRNPNGVVTVPWQEFVSLRCWSTSTTRSFGCVVADPCVATYDAGHETQPRLGLRVRMQTVSQSSRETRQACAV